MVREWLNRGKLLRGEKKVLMTPSHFHAINYDLFLGIQCVCVVVSMCRCVCRGLCVKIRACLYVRAFVL